MISITAFLVFIFLPVILLNTIFQFKLKIILSIVENLFFFLLELNIAYSEFTLWQATGNSQVKSNSFAGLILTIHSNSFFDNPNFNIIANI